MRSLALTLCAVILLTIFLWSGQEIVIRLSEYQAARSEYIQLREQVDIPAETSTETEDENTVEGINFDALYTINPNVVGWIFIPYTTIDYPVVQGADNERYLRYTFSGQRNSSGAIFLDYRNNPDFSDPHTLVYGHNMQDGSMFSSLQDWNGDRFILHTPNGILEYIVFNRQIVSANHEMYTLPNVVADSGMQVVTLSTCISGRPYLRYVVQGRLLEP